ncbi:leucine-rich repeat and fibronectin type-III domain-containing protein 4 [Alligator mississippiensis]|uniref:leucine-rich repeat and fibronectin type-III domain-containing protein 4 n=1 Tax=Alligator mississippiensis TaxID=8496 RepID=UPI0006ECBEF0|nr:leucine-rich repeat and fibronectin type-III domain-containing protein 4 [Alligator mississippiensis]
MRPPLDAEPGRRAAVAAVLGLALAAGALLRAAAPCPVPCVCHNLSESLSTLCARRGLLAVPLDVDRRTVELRLADNFIRAVGPPDFANMSGLVDLTLARNGLETLRPLAFGDLESLRALHLDGNRLAEIGPAALRGLLNLQHLSVNNNQLVAVAPAAFADFQLSLEDLDLSYNNLREAPWAGIRGMANLHTLQLEHNLIGTVEPGVFSELARLARLDLTSNRLATLAPEPALAVTPAALALSFGGNPLRCNCELLWLRRLGRDAGELETCAAPPAVAGRYFWAVPEEDFVCEPPLVARHTRHLRVLEGQRAALRCRALGDPEPVVHWVAPGERMVANSSRAVAYPNGTLELAAATLGDAGAYTCIAVNAAGEATARVELRVLPLPHGDGGGAAVGLPGPSDMAAKATGNTTGEEEEEEEKEPGQAVEVAEVTAHSALVQWEANKMAPTAWVYQLQYNCTDDEVLVYRILPGSSRHFLLKHLVPGAAYDLCVLAVAPDTATALASTHRLGCTHFATGEAAAPCNALRAHVLGGTLTVAVGGVLVATLLIFAVAVTVRARGCAGAQSPKLADVHSQTNGAPLAPPPAAAHGSRAHTRRAKGRPGAKGTKGAAGGRAPARRSCSLDMGACSGYAKRLGALWARRSQSVHGMLAGGAGEAALRLAGAEELEESVV